MGDARGRLNWVEAGRGLAACLVMASHAYVVRPIPIDPRLTDRLGEVGVGFFFVLSGFIMVHVHGRDLGRPATVPHFAWRRLVRIWPTYWLVLAIALLVNRLQRPAMHVHPDLGWVARQLTLWPGDLPFVGPAWTLRHELLFYTLFVALLVHRRAGLLLFAGWTAAVGVSLIARGLPSGPISWTTLVLHPLNLSFPVGMALGWAVRTGRDTAFAVGTGALGGGLLLLSDPRATLVGTALIYGGLLGLLVRLSAGTRGPGPALVWLGAISYSLYLLHLSVYALLRGAIDLWPGLDAAWLPRLIGQMAVAVAAAGLLHAWFERPLLRRLGAVRHLGLLSVARPDRPEVAARL
jgi:peptidoglycan/LPS O-acetylase OafA/YrhL